MRSFLAITLALALAAFQPVVSVPALTSPVASTTGHGGKTLTVAWKDNGNSPKLSSWQGINIFLATGDVNTQFKLQQLATNISTKTKHGKYAVEPSIGPNGGFYFIRMESVAVNSTGIPDMAFSSKFTLDDMTGTFNSTVQAAASSNAATSSSSSTTKSSSSGNSSMSVSSASRPASSASTPSSSTTGTTSSSASTSNDASSSKVQQTLILLGVASASVAGLVVLL